VMAMFVGSFIQRSVMALSISALLHLVAGGTLATAQPATQPTPSIKLSAHEGLVSPSKRLELSSILKARLRSVPVEEGQRVQAGDLVARLSDRLQAQEVAAAKRRANQSARIAKAKAALQQADLKVQRLSRAYESNAASEWELSKARIQKKQAEAALRVARQRRTEAEANLALQQARLEQYRVRVPFADWIDQIRLSEGATLEGQKTILTLLKLDPLEADLQLPVKLYGHLQPGRRYHREAGEPVNREVISRLTYIARSIDPASRTFRCVFTIDNRKLKLPAGFPVHLASLTALPAGRNANNRQQAQTY